MKISSSFNSTDRNKTCQSFKGVPPNPKYIPEFIGKIGKVAGKYINTPEQKLFLATTALMFQPVIDLKFAQEDKQTDAAIKSASKSIAGGLTGVLIRAGFIHLTTSKIGFKKVNKLNNFFFPEAASKLYQTEPELTKLQLTQYSQTLGTLFAILFMTFFSNSNIDVPLTSDLQDLLSGVIKENKTCRKSLADVATNRANKIKAWLNKRKTKLMKINNKISGVIKVLTTDTITEAENKKT